LRKQRKLLFFVLTELRFLADRANGLAIGIALRPSSFACRLSSVVCDVMYCG